MTQQKLGRVPSHVPRHISLGSLLTWCDIWFEGEERRVNVEPENNS